MSIFGACLVWMGPVTPVRMLDASLISGDQDVKCFREDGGPIRVSQSLASTPMVTLLNSGTSYYNKQLGHNSESNIEHFVHT